MGRGPVCFATPDLRCSHPTTRGQSKPHRVIVSGGFLIIFKGAEKISEKGVWFFFVADNLSCPFLQGC